MVSVDVEHYIYLLVITRYTSVTATCNIYCNTSLLRNNNGSSQLDLFICVNYPPKFILRTCLFYCLFATPLRVLFSLILRFYWILVLRSLCVNVLFSSVIVFFSFSGLLFFFFHNSHRLLQCCALVIRMCTICITRFLICVYSLASQRLTITFLVSQSHD